MSIRKVRIALAGVVLILFVAVFVGGKTDAPLVLAWLPRSQFVPGLLKTVAGAAGMGIAVLTGLLVLTVLFGRVYCSFLCPLGIFQDLFIWISKRLRSLRKGRKGRRIPSPRPMNDHAVVRYGILTLTAGTCVWGAFTLLNLFDPYSLFGRLMRDAVLPPLSLARRLVACCLEPFDVYVLSGPSTYLPAWSVWTISMYSLLVLVTMAVMWGRLYCNAVCPVGALLSVFSRLALFRVRIRDDDCVSCGLCEQGCRAGCIDLAAKEKIAAARCVMCMDCVSLCPSGAVAVSRAPAALVPVTVADRRRFLAGSASSLSIVMLGFPLRRSALRLRLPSALRPIVPPGAVSAARFARQCSACHLCVAACPYHAIQPSVAGHGGVGALQPAMSYTDGFCKYECNRCGQVCPTGAIEPLSLVQKKLTQIGRVRLIENRCVVYTRHEDCGACAELCPTHAVYTEEQDGVLYPKTDATLCIGCGACEHVCPKTPKAILVDAVETHGLAARPFSKQPKPEPLPAAAAEDDFPF